MKAEKPHILALADVALTYLPSGIRQFVKFGMVGGVGFVVDAGVLWFCMTLLGLGPYSGRVVSFIAAATTTWFCNRVFTFRGQGTGALHKQWLKFVLVSIGGFTFNYGAYYILMETQPLVREYPTLGVAAGSLAGMFFNFFVARRVVFK